MYLSTQVPDASPRLLNWQRVFDWAQSHYRDRSFNKDEEIPARPGLLYIVKYGAIRLVGMPQSSLCNIPEEFDSTLETLEETFLGFVGAGQPFEILANSLCNFRAYAHLDQTSVVWMYWQDLDNWPHFREEVFDVFRYQHQRKLLWLSILGQRRTIDRLLGFVTFLVEEYGEPREKYYCLRYPLTHSQIGSAIGSTRVTVTRLMGKLRQLGLISIQEDNLICLPVKFGSL